MMIHLKGVKATYNSDNRRERVIFDSLNLEIKRGEFVTILGTNGSGKSTLFKLISGEKSASAGNIFIDGVDVTALNEEKRSSYVARVFQNPESGSAAGLTLRENMSLALVRGKKRSFLRWGVKKREEAKMIKALKKLGLGLEAMIDEPIETLSGGQRQCVTLLMATLTNPSVLLLDEHTSALDPISQEKVMELTQAAVLENNTTTLCITHNLQHALRFGNRLILIKNGSVILDVANEQKAKLSEEALVSFLDESAFRERKLAH